MPLKLNTDISDTKSVFSVKKNIYIIYRLFFLN